MKCEKILLAMDLLDDTLIAEASPENAKNIKRRKTHTAAVHIGAIAACLLLIAGGISFVNHESVHTTPPTVTENIIYEVKPQAYVKFEKTLEECVAEADFIVHGSVSEIKAAILEDGYELSSAMSEDALRQSIRRIYTPISFVPDTIYKTTTITSSETAYSDPTECIPQIDQPLSLKGRYGTYQGYRLSPMSTQILLEEDQEYILFLYINPTGSLSIWHQPSLVIRADGTFSSLMSNTLYDDFESVDEILAYFEALASE